MVIILISTNFVYIFYGSGDLQSWNESKQNQNSTDIEFEKSKTKINDEKIKKKSVYV